MPKKKITTVSYILIPGFNISTNHFLRFNNNQEDFKAMMFSI